ncbi:MAG TPA: 3-hydroxyacyl-CoA dehydrogenase NAD-binding domain-containing protein [Pyrinomonadaceae bacterium]|nr:3-hydroxyacyl-CoA dehydrogenase NAD-binding domain-containing protein [Pyrinomonadaceae bacterium]
MLGAGTMGHGIAQVAAAAGYAVVMHDVNAEALARGRESIESNLARGIKLGKHADA